MTAKYTPAPWEMEVSEECIWMIDSSFEQHFIAMIRKHFHNAEANAKLIAAAPDMLDMLETIENDSNQVPEWLWNRIQAVIKKATE